MRKSYDRETPQEMQTDRRKRDHIRINLEEDVTHRIRTGFDAYWFVHNALPELDLADVDLSTSFFGHSLGAPFLISSITGGTPEAQQINIRLAEAAQAAGIAMGLGSLRAAIENADLAATYQVRRWAPDILLFANIGAVQLNYGFDVSHCQRAVEMVEANGLILHLNPLQEALQPEGNTRWSGVLAKIETLCRALPVPVIAKEVGWGISARVALQLANAGISAVDVAGAGGTSWSQVEMYRARDPIQRSVAAHFRDWGIPTAEALQSVRQALPGMPVIASGGMRHGLHVAKALALGATLAGLAGPFLRAASDSPEAVADLVEELSRTLRVAMFAVGVPTIAALQSAPLERRPDI
jgi:isopentenyl-diphosphate delta-isomerase